VYHHTILTSDGLSAMGLDVYVGTLTRYYTRDWETIMQQYAREQGMPLKMVRPDGSPLPNDAPDLELVKAALDLWRGNLAQASRQHVGEPITWEEWPDAPYFTDKPGFAAYSSLLLWAAYDDNPDCRRPVKGVSNWTKDRAFRRSNARKSQTRYPSLVQDVELWLPGEFSCVFEGPDIAGNKIVMGSVDSLCDELRTLNERTWRADEATIGAWSKEATDDDAPLEAGARFGFAVFSELAGKAREHRLVMQLDY
jgi:hypothetical protein